LSKGTEINKRPVTDRVSDLCDKNLTLHSNMILNCLPVCATALPTLSIRARAMRKVFMFAVFSLHSGKMARHYVRESIL